MIVVKRGLFLLLFGFGWMVQAQEVQVILGPEFIGENQTWTITATVKNGQLESYGAFPDIPGFRKRGTSTQSQTSIINGRISSSHSVVMTYSPVKQGEVTIPPFTLEVNGLKISSRGKTVKVGPPVQRNDPFSMFFDDDGRSDNREFVDVKDEAQFALTTSKNAVYIGEGFTVTLSFLISNDNRAPMQFYQLGKQLTDILKKIRPKNCWEENFNIESVEGEPIEINGKGFTQYKIYQGTFFPLNNTPIVFPSLGLEMIKYKVAKNPSFFGQNRKEDFKTFYTRSKTIQVKQLPDHPLRDMVAVGRYRLSEKLPKGNFSTGQSILYDFSIVGEGNISGIAKPMVVGDENFDFYEPNVNQTIRRQNNLVTGSKTFSYYLIPKEPGTFELKDYFQWIYFDPYRARYDTLVSSNVLSVEGKSYRNNTIENADAGSFYDRISLADNNLRSMTRLAWLDVAIPVFMLLMLLVGGYFFFKQ